LKALDDRLTDAEQRRVAAEASAIRAQQTLENVLGSPSWRLTKPLRTAKKFVRR
jgi:hypothetical protein